MMGVEDRDAGDPSPQGEGGPVHSTGPGGVQRRHKERSTLSKALPRALRKRMTPQEVKLWNWLREELAPAGFHFRRQVAIGRFIVDFACLKHRVIVEVDGEQHGFDDHAADRLRDGQLATLGFRVLRFSNRDIDREKRAVMDTIYAAVTRNPTPCAAAQDPPLEGRDHPSP
jgi:very-short-patch-repair endonuclease